MRGFTDRFMQYVSPEPNSGCWLWLGYRCAGDYGRFHISGKQSKMAHAVAYEMAGKEIPYGKELDHLCRVRCCVNPDHLEPVTHRENIRRGMVSASNSLRGKAVTQCPQGHLYSEENTVLKKHRIRGVEYNLRECRECNRLRCAARYARVHNV